MATTKINPVREGIKKNGLKKSLTYIQNKEKTDDEALVTGIDCFPPTAYDEFMVVKRIFSKTDGVLGYHVKQNFKPGETTKEIAHEIGVKLAKEFLKGKYQAVVATHIDKKHLHNHIVFNSVSQIDGRKYTDTIKEYYDIRALSDKLCKEYGLSVIEPKEKGKHYKEWLEAIRGNSWKDKIKNDIDLAIKNTDNYEDLIIYMINEGYSIRRGKYISFRPEQKDRFVRGKTLGFDYSEEGIKHRIELKKLGFLTVTIKKKGIIKEYRLIKANRKKVYRNSTKSLIRLSFMFGIKLLKNLMKRNDNLVKNKIKFSNNEVIDNLEKQLILMDNEKIRSPKDYLMCEKSCITDLSKVNGRRRKLDSERDKAQNIIRDIEIFLSHEKYLKSWRNKQEKRACIAARDRLIEYGIIDISEKEKAKFEKILLVIDQEDSILKVKSKQLREKRELLNDLGNTINRILNKEKPFTNKDRDDRQGR